MTDDELDFGIVSNYKNEYKKIVLIARELRYLRGECVTVWTDPTEWAVKYSHMHGRPAKALTITLTPTGCEWAESGGCTMCGEFEGSRKTAVIPAEFHIAQFATAIAKLVPKYKPSWLRINQEGNYTNSHEMNSTAQLSIIELAAQIRGIKRITIEARPKYLKEEILSYFGEVSKRNNVEIEIGMGFEAENDVVRNVCINKGENINDFCSAIEMMNKTGILPLAYVLLKPPFLTEGEAITEAIKSVRYATEIGFKRISLEPMSIHNYTVVDALSRIGSFRVPWLWSVIEVAKSCKDIPDFGIGGIGYYPRPFHLSHNHCTSEPDCDDSFWEALAHFSRYRDFSVFDKLDCPCKSEWESECIKTAPSLKERMNEQLSRINIKNYKKALEGATEEAAPIKSILIAGGSQIHYVSNGK